MYTKPYDNSTGIVKMGTKVPETGINLAYIGNSKQEDAYGSVNVINNKEYTNIIPFEQVMYVDGSYKLSTNIQDKPIETDNILVTNVFTETSDNTPLYYFYKCNGTIKKVLSEETAYVGPDIIISPVNKGTGLGGRHKIILTPVGPSSCEITIYTNFISDNTNAYTVSYNKQDGGTTYNTTELLNLDTIFKQVSYDESWPGDYTDQKVYAIKENGSNFDIYVTSNQAEVQIPTVRKEIGFTYKIDALVDGTCSPGLTKTIKTGVIFIKGSPSEAVMDALKKLKDSLPNYIKMVNPHPKGIVTGWISGTVGATVQTTTTVVDDTTSTYWIADPAMPLSHMYDYDLLIYAGAGADTTIINTTMADNIKKYLEAGGNLWIDNNGTLPSTLLTLGKLNLGVSFEYAEATYSAAYNTLDYLSVLSRYGTVDVSKIGFADNENKMNVVFNAPGYEIENVVARYNTASPSTRQNKVIIGRKDKSLIIASSNGILSGIIYNKANAINIASNIMFRLAERKWYTSGDISCSVLNKNSLFDIDYDNSMLEMPYTNGYNTRQESVAFRKIIPNIYEKTKEYLPDIQPNDAVEFYISKKNNDVEIYPVKEKYEKNDIVYAYTTKDTVKWNISNDSDISVSFPKIAVDMTFDTYVCKKDTTNTYVEKTDFASINYVTNQINISQRDGVVDLGYLKIIVAGTKSGLEWSDPSFVYYRIRSGKYTMGEFVEEPLKLNFMIYDEQTGKFFVSKTGDLIISASNVTNSMKLKVCLDYRYTVLKTKFFSIKSESNGIQLLPPSDNDHTIPWYVRIKNGSFIQTRTITAPINPYPNAVQVQPDGTAPAGLPIGTILKTAGGYYKIVTPPRIVGKRLVFVTPKSRYNPKSKYWSIKLPDPVEVGLTTTRYYQVREYYDQIFTGKTGIAERDKEIATFIDNNMIKVDNVPLYVSEDYPLVIIKRNKNLSKRVKVRLTTEDNLTFTSPNPNWMVNPSPQIIFSGLPYPDMNAYTINYAEGSVTFNNEVSDIYASYTFSNDQEIEYDGYDKNSGYIKLKDEIDYTDNILVSYCYEQDSLIYKGYEEGGVKHHLDLNPSLGHYATFSTPNNPATLLPSFKLINKTIYIMIVPYKSNDGILTNTTIKHYFTKEEVDNILMANKDAILLGEIQIRETSSANDLVLFDTRRRGGGLKEWESDPKAADYWDIGDWDGKPYQTQGSAIISLPKKVLKTTITNDDGTTSVIGNFSETEIESIVNKHVALGIVPIVNFVDSDSSALEASITARNIEYNNIEFMLTIPSILGFELIVGSAVEFAISVITDDEEQQEEN